MKAGFASSAALLLSLGLAAQALAAGPQGARTNSSPSGQNAPPRNGAGAARGAPQAGTRVSAPTPVSQPAQSGTAAGSTIPINGRDPGGNGTMPPGISPAQPVPPSNTAPVSGTQSGHGQAAGQARRAHGQTAPGNSSAVSSGGTPARRQQSGRAHSTAHAGTTPASHPAQTNTRRVIRHARTHATAGGIATHLPANRTHQVTVRAPVSAAPAHRHAARVHASSARTMTGGQNAACNVNKPCPNPIPPNLAPNLASGACVYNHGMAVSAAHRPAGSPPDKHRTCRKTNHQAAGTAQKRSHAAHARQNHISSTHAIHRKTSGCNRRHGVTTHTSVLGTAARTPHRSTMSRLTGKNGACNVNKPCPNPIPPNLALNPASGACVYNHGMAVSSAHRPPGSPPDKGRTCTRMRRTRIVGREITGSPCEGSSTVQISTGSITPQAQTLSSMSVTHTKKTSSSPSSFSAILGPISHGYAPPAVPAHATLVSQVRRANSLLVTYRAGLAYFLVRYEANGHYTVMKSDSRFGAAHRPPQVLAAHIHAPSSKRAVHAVLVRGGTLHRSIRGGGIAILPRTGGGGAPARRPFTPPLLPIVIALGLIGLGAGVRRAAPSVSRF
jgi:hypothetical protein